SGPPTVPADPVTSTFAIAGTLYQPLRHAHAQRRADVLAERGDDDPARAAVEAEGRVLPGAGLQDQPGEPEAARLILQRREQTGAEPAAGKRGCDVHPLDLAGRVVDAADRAATARLSADARHQES